MPTGRPPRPARDADDLEALAARYDERYFDRWYRHRGFGSPRRLERKVAYALGVTEYLLERPVRSVLDVGCGEGVWREALLAHRPRLRYVGVDPSTYCIERYGGERNLRLGRVGDLPDLALGGPFDLVVCVDVLGYVPDAEARTGLAAIDDLLAGVLLLEVFVAGDEWEGDRAGYHERPRSTYDRWFRRAGLRRIGPNLLAGSQLLPHLASLERG